VIELWKTPKTAVPNDTGFVRKYVISTNIVNRQSIGKADLADSCGLKSFPGLETPPWSQGRLLQPRPVLPGICVSSGIFTMRSRQKRRGRIRSRRSGCADLFRELVWLYSACLATTFALLIVMGVTGTSRISIAGKAGLGCAPVLTVPILSTMSMPSITFPKTV